MLAEMCIVLLGIGMLGALCIPVHEFSESDYYGFADGYWQKQSEAIAHGESRCYETGGGDQIWFNEKGNVNQAKTITKGQKNRRIVIELGGGRLVFK